MTAFQYFFASNQQDQTDLLVLQNHYSRRIPSATVFIGSFHLPGGIFGDLGECIAACYFGWPPTRWKTQVLELTRLVRHEDYLVPLTSLISICLRHIKRKNIASLIISYADSQQGHHGGIYQAASWNFHSKRAHCIDGVLIDGKFIPGRQSNDYFGTRSVKKLQKLFPYRDIRPHYDDGKFLYWKALNKEGERQASQLGLERNWYPKPSRIRTSERGCTHVEAAD